MVNQKKIGGNYYYKFMKKGKVYCGICEGCASKREAEAYEEQIRSNVSAIVEKQSTASLVNTFRKTIENIGENIGEINKEDKADARASLELLRERLADGVAVTLAEAFTLYLKQPTRRKAATHQINVNRTYWNDFTAFMLAKFPEVVNLADVTAKHAKEYITLLRTSGAFCKEINYSRHEQSLSYQSRAELLSPRTINARHKAIKAVFSRLADDAGLLKNPFDLPTLNNDTANREAFTDEELRLIADHMSMPYTKPIFTIGLCTGLTLGDICMLRWREISGNWITNKQRMKTKVRLEIPILPPLAAFLLEQRRHTGDQEFVCPELAEMYQSNPSGVFYRVKEFLEGIGISTVSKIEGRTRAVSTKAAHAMRHTFAYLAGVYNVPQPIVQSVLGHLTPRMTELYQQHAQREQKEKFFQQMPNVLGAPAAPLMIGEAVAGAVEPEREQMKQLAGTLPIEIVREIVGKYGRVER